jgi:hypothetical protein
MRVFLSSGRRAERGGFVHGLGGLGLVAPEGQREEEEVDDHGDGDPRREGEAQVRDDEPSIAGSAMGPRFGISNIAVTS